MPLSIFDVKAANPKDKPYRLADGAGLYLQILPNGSKLWRFRYRFAGVEKMLSVDAFPIVSIADARRKRDDARRLLESGIDPTARKRLDRLAAETAARTAFGLVANEYLANLEANGVAAATLSKNRWLLEELAKPLSGRPVSEITAAEMLELLKRIERSGRRESARRLRAVVSAVFRLAVATLRAPNDPTYALRGALLRVNSKPRSAITSEPKLGEFMRAIDGFDGWPAIRAALLFTALTFARPGEVRGDAAKRLSSRRASVAFRPSAPRCESRTKRRSRARRSTCSRKSGRAPTGASSSSHRSR